MIALEYPIGTTRYRTAHSIQFPRVSPDGRRIAFLEATDSAQGGYVALLNLSDNRVTALTDRFLSARGLAWSADGREVWFTAGDSRAHRVLYAANGLPGGQRLVRVVNDSPGSLTLFDIAADGAVLLTRDEDRRSLLGKRPNDMVERDLSM